MSNTMPPLELPTDLAGCQALLEQLAFTISEQVTKIEQLQADKEQLQLKLNELLQAGFRHRSERYLDNPDQLRLDFGDSDAAADAACGLAEAIEEIEQTVAEHKRRRKRRNATEQFPAHWPRYEVEAEIPEDVKTCPEHGPRKLIGYDTTETAEWERPKGKVRITKYAKYVCQGCEHCGVHSPDREPGLVLGNRYDTSIAAEIITGKYGFHLPIYRQQDCFAGSGWCPARSTLINLLAASAVLLDPLIRYFGKLVLDSGLLGTDDTRVTLLLPPVLPKVIEGDAKSARIYEVLSEARAQGKPSVSGRMWAYRGMTIPLNVFDFTVSRHRDGPDLFLQDFSGKLMADCYSGYQGIELRTDGKVQRAACVAHARRKVFDARESYPLECATLLAWFQQLYDLEDQGKAMSPQERLALRQSKAKAIWQAMGRWLESGPAQEVLPKSPLGEALRYLRNHWDALQVYLSDARMPIDNNDVEQLMKQVAIGRRNWLFIGSVDAGERAAGFLTLVSSAVRNDLDVWAYVKDVLDQLLAGSTDYEALRPDVWKQSHPQSIRTYRVEERRDRADRKQRRREQRRRNKSR